MINKIINKFLSILNFAKQVHIVTSDMNVIAVRELQAMVYQLNPNDFVNNYNALDQALEMLKNRGQIFDFERIDKGFKIIPQDKIYISEDDLIVKFDTE